VSLQSEVPAIVDRAAGGRVLVFGSLPPVGRDLDLLVRPAEEESVARALAQEGFVSRGVERVVFKGCSAYTVDLVPAGRWGLPAHELDALFADAQPVEGFENLARPSARHQLLVLARIGFSEKRRARIDAALAEDPDAWTRARESAPAWNAGQTLSRLQARYEGRALSRPRLRRRRGFVVALSGLDGAGKSGQAEALRAALEQLGHPSAVEWLPLADSRSIAVLSSLARRTLGLVRVLPPFRRLSATTGTGGSLLAAPDGEAPPAGPARRLALGVWTTMIVLSNALAQRRAAKRHVRRGRVAVFDRYTLDSLVRLRTVWGDRKFGLQRWLLRTLPPRPLCAFLLDVAPETAIARKQDQWDLESLRRQADRYREEAEELGVRRLDGERPRDELCAEIAETVWELLGP